MNSQFLVQINRFEIFHGIRQTKKEALWHSGLLKRSLKTRAVKSKLIGNIFECVIVELTGHEKQKQINSELCLQNPGFRHKSVLQEYLSRQSLLMSSESILYVVILILTIS